MTKEEELIEKIGKESKGFQKLLDNHYSLKKKIQKFDIRKYLSPADEAEMKKLKKLKLKEKDIMVHMMEEYSSKQA